MLIEHERNAVHRRIESHTCFVRLAESMKLFYFWLLSWRLYEHMFGAPS